MAQRNRPVEIGTGLFVLLGLAALAFLTSQLPGSGLQLLEGPQGYTVTAEFGNIGGLRAGAPVSMAGVAVGRVDRIGFNSQDYRAVVTMSIDQRFNQIPDDSTAEIQTSGLLGAQYISISPGASEKFLHAGSQIPFTQSALVLENLINRLFAQFASKSSNGAAAGSAGGGAGAAGPPPGPPGGPPAGGGATGHTGGGSP